LALNKAQFAGNADALPRTATLWSANWGSPAGRAAKRSSPLLPLLGVFQYTCEGAPRGRALGDSLFECIDGYRALDDNSCNILILKQQERVAMATLS